MQWLGQAVDLMMHLDIHLTALATTYGWLAYALLFLIIFCETGLVVTPFLPGDSLLFAAGTLAATTNNILNVHLLFLLLAFASILGNSANYSIGRKLGPKVFHSANGRLLNKAYLEKAHHFYQQYGGKTLILARFMPIIRTFAPFIAGVGYMPLRQFMAYNLIGAGAWTGSLLYLSYWFGNIPIIKQHFSSLVISVIIISLLPPFIELLRYQHQKTVR